MKNSIEMKYCIRHEYYDQVHIDEDGEFHLHIGTEEASLCKGPFVSCEPPPELEENWQDHLPVSTSYEFNTVSSYAALRLQADFLGIEYPEICI